MPSEKSVSGGVKTLLRVEGLSLFIASCLLYHYANLSWGLFFTLFLLPDISFLGYIAGSKIGSAAYNTVHSYILPLVLGIALYIANASTLAPYLLIWTAHIGLDRALGYGLKYATHFGDTHLGKIGKWKKAAAK